MLAACCYQSGKSSAQWHVMSWGVPGKIVVPSPWSIHREIICSLVYSGGLFHQLHQHIIGQAAGSETEPVRVHPIPAEHFMQHHQVMQGGFGGGMNWNDFMRQARGGSGGVEFDMGDLGEMFGDIFGGIFGKQAGGPVAADRPYIVGEAGPELFVPKAAGTILPNGQGMGGVTNVTNITNNVSAIDAKSVAQFFAENRRTLLGTVQLAQKEMPYGNR